MLAVWALWRVWEAASGTKLGVKLTLKTVVTGAAWDAEGKPRAVSDPGLHLATLVDGRLADGARVPFLRHDEPYKHLGVLRRADGEDRDALRRLESSFNAAIARVRKLYRPSRRTLFTVSNALNGVVAFVRRRFGKGWDG